MSHSPVYELGGDKYKQDSKVISEHLEMYRTNTGDDKSLTLAERKKEGYPEVQKLSPEDLYAAEKALVRKIDFRLLPMVVLMYIMNYLDRNNIASARLAGLEDDLNLSDSQYRLSVSILFVGYILMQIPSNLLLDKIGKPAPYLTTAMIIWGIISSATAGVTTYGGLLATRFMLGVVEAAFYPGVIFCLSSWYTKKELAFRTAILYSGSLISGMFSGLIAAGILAEMDYRYGLRAWRWLFIIEGGITIGIAIIAYFILPNFPSTTKWLSPEERQIAQWRLEVDVGEADEHANVGGSSSAKTGLKLAFKDPRTYVLTLLVLGIVSSGGVTNFFPTVVATLNYSKIRTLCLTAPPYALCTITALANAWHSDRTGEKTWHIIAPLLVALASFIIAASTTAVGPRYFSMMIMVPGCYSAYVVAIGWISNSIPRPAAKRAVAVAFVNCISNGSSIYVSYLYPKTDSPRFLMAFCVNAGTIMLAIVMVFILRRMLMNENKQIEADNAEGKTQRAKFLY